MRFFLFGLVLSAYLWSYTAMAFVNQQIANEVKLRETPAQFYQEINQRINFALRFQDNEEFKLLATEHGFTANGLENELRWLTRINLETGTGIKGGLQNASTLIEFLQLIDDTPFDTAYLALLKGRLTGRQTQDYQQAIQMTLEGLQQDLDQGIQENLLLYAIHYQLGDLYRITLQSNLSQQHLKQAQELAYTLKDNYLIAQAEAALGRFYNLDKQYNKSLEHYIEAVRVSDNLNKTYLNSVLSIRLASVYRDLESWEQALVYANKAAEGFNTIQNWPRLSHSMTIIAMIYGKQGRWNQAIDYYLNALQLDTEHGNVTAQALSYHNLGEAYFKDQRPDIALEFLLKANEAFTKRNSTLYLVYNNLLIAEVASSQQDWQITNYYANQALIQAKELNLNEQILEALQHQAKALKELGQTDLALATIELLLEHNQQQKKLNNQAPKQTFDQLAEQQLKMQLILSQNQLQIYLQQLRQYRLQFILSLFISSIVGFACYHQWHRKRKLKQRYADLQLKLAQEPISGLTGYNGFISEFNKTKISMSLAMLSLTNKHNSDMELGTEVSLKHNKQLIAALSQSIAHAVYFIRPGVFLLTIEKTHEHEQILQKLRSVINQQYGFKDTTLQVGIIDLPLTDNPDITLSPATYFNVLQMLTAAAISLGKNKDNFVSIAPLGFAPTTIFSPPVYQHLGQAIKRGLVKVTCNGNKAEINWPHGQPELKKTTELVNN